jgi:hypothetical protein
MMQMEKTETYVKLITASGLQEADLWKAVLEANGIPVFLRNEATAFSETISVGGLGPVDLWVSRDDAARAMEILQDERVQPENADEEP